MSSTNSNSSSDYEKTRSAARKSFPPILVPRISLTKYKASPASLKASYGVGDIFAENTAENRKEARNG